MLIVERAQAGDSGALSDLAARSEAHWGYDAGFMERFRTIYGLSGDFINSNPTFTAQENDRIVGFYALVEGEPVTSLEYFFIEPEYIGKGYGKELWKHMVQSCRKFGIRELDIVTSPQAKAFYTKLGAVQVGEVESLVREGRMIPQLRYKLEE